MSIQLTFQLPSPHLNLTYIEVHVLRLYHLLPLLAVAPPSIAPKHLAVSFPDISILIVAVFCIYMEVRIPTSPHLWWSLWCCLSHDPPCHNPGFGFMITCTSLESSASSIPHCNHYLLCLQLIYSGISIPTSCWHYLAFQSIDPSIFPLSITPSLLFLPSLGSKAIIGTSPL